MAIDLEHQHVLFLDVGIPLDNHLVGILTTRGGRSRHARRVDTSRGNGRTGIERGLLDVKCYHIGIGVGRVHVLVGIAILLTGVLARDGHRGDGFGFLEIFLRHHRLTLGHHDTVNLKTRIRRVRR